MRRGCGVYSGDVESLGDAIDAIARKCWRGLPALMGRASVPSKSQILDAFRVAGVESDAGFILAEWSAILEAVQVFSRSCPDDWMLYLEYAFLVEMHRVGWGKRGAVDVLAGKYEMSPYDVRKITRSVPRRIAALVSMSNLTYLDK